MQQSVSSTRLARGDHDSVLASVVDRLVRRVAEGCKREARRVDAMDPGLEEMSRVVRHAQADFPASDGDDVRRRNADVGVTHGHAALELESRIVEEVPAR